MVEALSPLARHQMVWVDPASWREMLDARSDLPFTPMLDIWAESGWPLVARRPACCDKAGEVPLGLPLPPHHGRHRLRITLSPDAIIRTEQPPRMMASGDSVIRRR